MEEVHEFKYLGSVMCKHDGTEGETRERALQGRKVVGSLRHIMNGRSVSMEVEGFEKYSNSTNPHICKRNMGLE